METHIQSYEVYDPVIGNDKLIIPNRIQIGNVPTVDYANVNFGIPTERKPVYLIVQEQRYTSFIRSYDQTSIVHKLFNVVRVNYTNFKNNNFDKSAPFIVIGEPVFVDRFKQYYGIFNENILGVPELPDNFCTDKVIVRKLFHQKDYCIPSAVVSDTSAVVNDMNGIVAKRSNSKSGNGVKFYSSLQELNDSGDQYDIIEEFIDIHTEYRLNCFRFSETGRFHRSKFDVFNVSKKVHNTNFKQKSLNDRIIFDNINLTNRSKEARSIIQKVQPILNDIASLYKNLNFIGIDVAVCCDGSVKLIEINSAPGLDITRLIKLYRAVHYVWYEIEHRTVKNLFLTDNYEDSINNNSSTVLQNDQELAIMLATLKINSKILHEPVFVKLKKTTRYE